MRYLAASLQLFVGFTTLCYGMVASSTVAGQELSINDIRYQSPYALVKSTVSASFAEGTSFEVRRQAARKAAESAYGSRAKLVLGGSEDLLSRIDGGEALIKRFGVNNRSVRKGALRAVRVAMSLDADPRFKIVALDQSVLDRNGKLLTDRDIVYQHRSTGSLGRIEVKDVTLESQRSNRFKYERQIRLMGEEQRRTGHPQAFVNRRDVSPELRRFAAQQRVLVFDNVVTSQRISGVRGTKPIAGVMNELDRSARSRLATSKFGLGFGIALVVLDGSQAYREWGGYRHGHGSWSQASYHTLMASAGGAFVTRNATSGILTRTNAGRHGASFLRGANRAAVPVAVALTVGAVGLRSYQWHTGEINTRKFALESSSTIGGLAGGMAGMWAGAAAGTVVGRSAGAAVGGVAGGIAGAPAAGAGAAPGAVVGTVTGGEVGAGVGAVIGGVVGAIGGAWAAQKAVKYGVESIFARLDETQRQQLFAELTIYYRAQSQ